MNKKFGLTFYDYLLIVGTLLIFFTFAVLMNYYFKVEQHKCLSEPLIYGAKQLEQEFGFKFIGSGFFRTPNNIKSPLIVFNSTSMFISNVKN